MIELKNKWINLRPEQRLYQCPLPLIGLTGGIATGKTTFSNWFKSQGLTVISADELVKKIYQEKETLDWARDQGLPFVGANIDFRRLREVFFSNPELKKKIEQYIYTKLPAFFKAELQTFPRTQCVLYDVPLLFEKKIESLFDQIILIYAEQETQIKRLLKRDMISPDLAQSILAQQISIEEKRSKTSWVIDNSSDDTPENNQDLKKIWSKLFDHN